MKVKCAICGLKGFFSIDELGEYHASRFIHIHISKDKKNFSASKNSKFICRKCVNAILDGLQFEGNRIDDLFKPKIKEK